MLQWTRVQDGEGTTRKDEARGGSPFAAWVFGIHPIPATSKDHCVTFPNEERYVLKPSKMPNGLVEASSEAEDLVQGLVLISERAYQHQRRLRSLRDLAGSRHRGSRSRSEGF